MVLTPLLPSAAARVALASPLAQNISESIGFMNRSKGSAGLALLTLIFFGMLTLFFLTGSMFNFIALGLIPEPKVTFSAAAYSPTSSPFCQIMELIR